MLRPTTASLARPLTAALGVLLLAGCGAGPAAPSASGDPTVASPAATPGPTVTFASSPSASGAETVSCTYDTDGEQAAKPAELPPVADVAATGTLQATFDLSGAPITLTLDRAAAPCTVNSFVSLARQGYFDDTSCHRLVDSGIFVLQCGDPSGTGSGGPGYSFADELPDLPTDAQGAATYAQGVVAMANAGPGTNGSQFFLVYADSQLPPDYTIFASMDTASRDAVAEIGAQGQDGSFGTSGKPNAPAEITGMTIS